MTSMPRSHVLIALMAIGLAACSLPPQSCVEALGDGCVDDEEIRRLADERVAAYAEDPAIQLQWGFGAIRVPEAYAHLERQFGPDAPPGKGVLIGVLDTGIDTNHPAFRNKTVVERFLAGSIDEDGSDFPTARR